MSNNSTEQAPSSMRYLWYSMYGFVTALAVYALFFRPAHPRQSEPVSSPAEPVLTLVESEKADVQIALILDTSSSMDGLVAQARTQVWDMVREMQIGPDGDEKTVAVALYQYGNNRLPKRFGYIEQLTPLTTDLDKVTVKLHSLRTSGGKEYAPLAISRACDELDWSRDDEVERYIVIAGNEGFQQGDVRGMDAMTLAEERQITILPIFCANEGASRTAVASWKVAAELAGTDFESIDPDRRVAKIDTPYDDLILEKYRQLQDNAVYAPGASPSQYSAQAEQYIKGGVAVERALVQSRQMRNKDLVSAYGSGKVELDSAVLPSHLQNKSRAEQEGYFQKKKETQETLRAELRKLEDKRTEHLRANAPNARNGAPASLGGSFKRSAGKSRGGLKTY